MAALIKCRGCGGNIHPSAEHCPHCGCSMPNETRRTVQIAIAIAFFMVILIVMFLAR